MKNLNRRNFIHRLCLAGGYALIPGFMIESPVFSKEIPKNMSFSKPENLRALQRNAKDAFYRKDYQRAEILYRDLIALSPLCIEFYDGLGKTYLAQDKLIEACRLMANACSDYPGNELFSGRYAKMLMRVAMGSKRAKEEYIKETGFTNLFEKSVSVYCAAIGIAPDKKYLRFALLDALYDLESYNRVECADVHLPEDLLSEIRRLSDAYFPEWQEYRTRAGQPQTPSVMSLSLLSLPERRTFYFVHEQEQWIFQHLKNKQKKQLELYKLLRPSPGQPPASKYNVPDDITLVSRELLTLIRKDARKNNNYSILYMATKKRFTRYPYFWTCIGFADAARMRGGEYLEQAVSVYRQAEQKLTAPDNKKINALYGGLAKCYYSLGRISEGKDMILKGLDMIYGTGGGALALILLYAEGYVLEENYTDAIKILVSLAKKYEVPEFNASYLSKDEPVKRFLFPDPVLDGQLYAIQQFRKKKFSDPDKVTICYALAKVYKLQGETDRLNRLREVVRGIYPGIQCF